MYTKLGTLAAIILGGAVMCSTAQAHHAFTAQYDPESAASMTGVVVRIEWLNPHAYFFIDVTDAATGEITSWACELASPAA